MVVLTGCVAVVEPTIAKINITINPNPVPYNSVSGYWRYTLNLYEKNGIGVTLTSLKFDHYNQEEELVLAQYEEDIAVWFGSNYLRAFSLLQAAGVTHKGTGTVKFVIITVEGIDDKDNPIEATGRVDFLPQ